MGDFTLGLTQLLPAVTKQIAIYGCFISDAATMNQVVIASRNANSLILRGCRKKTHEEFHFGGTQYKIQTLSFGKPDRPSFFMSIFGGGGGGRPGRDHGHGHGHGHHSFRGGRHKGDKFKNIIKGIANSKLKDSLTTIEIGKRSIEQSEAEEILAMYGLENIAVKVD